MVPEKRHLDLIRAFNLARLDDWKLALVGSIDLKDSYTLEVVNAAGESSNVVLTDFQTGEPLAELYGNAGVFVLPSTHEGLPIALLEALSYGLPAIASDIPANKEVGLPSGQYFRTGDEADMARCLRTIATEPRTEDYKQELRAWVKSKYDWYRIACSTLDIYRAVFRSA